MHLRKVACRRASQTSFFCSHFLSPIGRQLPVPLDPRKPQCVKRPVRWRQVAAGAVRQLVSPISPVTLVIRGGRLAKTFCISLPRSS